LSLFYEIESNSWSEYGSFITSITELYTSSQFNFHFFDCLAVKFFGDANSFYNEFMKWGFLKEALCELIAAGTFGIE
jgi:hypothetical protein